MHYWIREIVGWLLVAMGLYVFLMCLSILLNVGERSYFLEAGPLTIIGIVLFRGGIHLVKVATAARICAQVHKDIQRAAKSGRSNQI